MPSNKMIASPKQEQELMVELWAPDIARNPYNFVMFAFPWGQPNTPLEGISGPRAWQKKVLLGIAKHMQSNDLRAAQRELPLMLRKAIASGRGIGKSALVSWLTLWFMTCVVGGTVIVAANTEQQLRTRTWAEVSKWAAMALNSHWFDVTATTMRPAPWFADLLVNQLKLDTAYYYAQAQLWSEENPDAFAGAHNPRGLMLIFDEASGIPAPIWTVSEGFFTEASPYRFWFVYSNPRRNTGAFFECFNKNRAFWETEHIDARTVKENDQTIYQKIIDQYGEDSDEARVEVKGMFPNQGVKQFISNSLAINAQDRDPTAVPDPGAPLILGVDVARFGDDKSVIAFRKGRDAKSIPWQIYKGLDTTQLASKVAEAINKYNPDAVFVDGGGVGGGVVDQLKHAGYKIREVLANVKPNNMEDYSDKRTEDWATMREWLAVGAIPPIPELFDDLTGPEYDFNIKDNRLKLESVESMKRRNLASPDYATALALTFSQHVARIEARISRISRKNVTARDVDYAMF